MKKRNNIAQTLNGQPQPIQPMVQNAMFYPNTYLNFDAFGNYTKHYYNGMERVANRLGDNNTTIAIDNMLENRKLSLEERVRNEIQELISEPTQVDLPPVLDILNLQPTGTPNDIFYYHPNHLGSTSFVTDQNQNITQGFLYAPFGEITTEYNINFGNNTIPKYSFNAKELDEETGMYYYETRYYAPPVFTSRDPMFEKYFWISPYAYCANNPIKYVDPTGMDVEITGEDGSKTTYTQGMTYDGNDEFTKKTVNTLNEMNSTKNGNIVLGELVNSENVFNITNNVSQDGTAGFKENETGGGVLNMNGNTDLASVAHELFHGYQHEKGQGGASIFNEVEAYVFSWTVVTDYANKNETADYPTGAFPLARTDTDKGLSYEISVKTLFDSKTFPKDSFRNAVLLFKSQSTSNESGIYNSYPIKRENQEKYLLHSFYPLK